MASNATNEYLVDFQTSLEKLNWTELRSKATQVFGLKLTRDHTKEQIVSMIMEAVSKTNFAEAGDEDLKPGWAKIQITPIAGKVTFPVFTNTNGYECYIPIGRPVNVPIKVIETLENAKEMKKVQNEFGEYTDSLQPSYPYQVLERKEGPDPRPGYEVQRDRKWAPYKAFFKKFRYWPSAKKLEAMTAATQNFNMFNFEEEKDE